MLKKAKTILRSESGMSIIIVLSISALFVALSAAVLYAASLQTAAANRVLPQEDAYRMAYSFTENVLEPDLKSKEKSGGTPTALKKFLLYDFLDPNNFTTGDSYSFTSNGADSDAGETITITLRRVLPKDAGAVGTMTPAKQLLFNTSTEKTEVDKFTASDYTKYIVAMTVEAKVGGESYALTKRYRCQARFALGNDILKYSGDKFDQIGAYSGSRTLDEMKDGAAVGYYIWLPEGGKD